MIRDYFTGSEMWVYGLVTGYLAGIWTAIFLFHS